MKNLFSSMKLNLRAVLWSIKKSIAQSKNELRRKDTASFIKCLNSLGMKIEEDVIMYSPETLNIDTNRPTLISIKGGGTLLHENLTILTHDYVTRCFLGKYQEFVQSSGSINVGRNVWFGKNVTLLRGADIGDNCIIGYGSIVNKKIPANSVAAGMPAKVICSLDDFFQKRKTLQKEDAMNLARSIVERLHRRPVPEDFWDEFPLFVSGDEVDKYPEIPIKAQLRDSFDKYVNTHKAEFDSFESFLKASGIE